MDADYIALDEAIRVLSDWREEIVDELAKHAISWKAYDQVLTAMGDVHSPPDADP